MWLPTQGTCLFQKHEFDHKICMFFQASLLISGFSLTCQNVSSAAVVYLSHHGHPRFVLQRLFSTANLWLQCSYRCQYTSSDLNSFPVEVAFVYVCLVCQGRFGHEEWSRAYSRDVSVDAFILFLVSRVKIVSFECFI